MEFKEYQEAAKRTANHDIKGILERLEREPELVVLLNASSGLAGESGEVADHIKKVVFHGHNLDVSHVKKELGDILWYCSLAVEALNIELDDVAKGNIAKLLRRYPDGFSSERSINRAE